MTHDLLKTIIVGLGAELQRVVISALKDKTYFAELLLLREDHHYQFDARPSDSIALALRLHAPIFTQDQLLEQTAIEAADAEPQSSLDAEQLRRYLEKMDPQDFGRFMP
jgi:bifunctional DNase/RNase